MLIHKTMKMPTSCLSCWIAPTCEVWVREKSKYKGYDDRLDECPLEEVKHGHWIMTNKEKTDRPLPECSRCGWYVTKGGVLDFTYCPNCGAKMDEMKVNNSKGIDLWMTKEDFNSLYEDDVEDGV